MRAPLRPGLRNLRRVVLPGADRSTAAARGSRQQQRAEAELSGPQDQCSRWE
ncbi:Uncharacterised protein [Amycolatopsis camponoti]|uniref:Uncharacterized protein n=1 Tax=Amycolatopsis camponoti TaxID=2606593 RepID=A0A6I8LRL8_9PSEU|nr:Uncharacterised protein [Amycolatopsis camponoti]